MQTRICTFNSLLLLQWVRYAKATAHVGWWLSILYCYYTYIVEVAYGGDDIYVFQFFIVITSSLWFIPFIKQDFQFFIVITLHKQRFLQQLHCNHFQFFIVITFYLSTSKSKKCFRFQFFIVITVLCHGFCLIMHF